MAAIGAVYLHLPSDCKVVVGESITRQHRMVVCSMTGCKKDKEGKGRAEDKTVKAKKESVA